MRVNLTVTNITLQLLSPFLCFTLAGERLIGVWIASTPHYGFVLNTLLPFDSAYLRHVTLLCGLFMGQGGNSVKKNGTPNLAGSPVLYGGGLRIRTLGGFDPSTVFKTAAFDRSASPP